MTTALYIRVSTLNQVERESLKNQEERLIAYCKSNGITSYKIYKDAGVSAKDIKRPALELLLQDIEKGKIKTVIVTKLDRITRSLKDLIQLMEFFEKNNVKFISITQNIDTTGPMGRFMLNLLGSVAQVEREMTAERVSEDMHHRALTGKWNGGIIPYGYTTQQQLINQLKKEYSEDEAIKKASEIVPEPKRLYPNKEEAEIVKKIYHFYLETRSIRGATNKLNSQGFRTRNGMPWNASSILRILINPIYTGRICYGKRKTNLTTGKLESVPKEEWKIVEGEHERIIDDETFYKVQELVKEKQFKNTRTERIYLLNGLLKCGKCKGSMYGHTWRRFYKSKKTEEVKLQEYFWYRCQNYKNKGSNVCDGLSVSGKILEEKVIEEIKKISKKKEFLNDKEKLLKIVEEKLSQNKPSYEKEITRLKKEEKELERRREVLIEKLEKEVIDDEVFKKEFEKLTGLLNQNREKQAELTTSLKTKEFSLTTFKEMLKEIENFKKNWDFLDEEGKRARIRSIIKEIVVYPDKLVIKIYVDSEKELLNLIEKSNGEKNNSGACGGTPSITPKFLKYQNFDFPKRFKIVAEMGRRDVHADGMEIVRENVIALYHKF